MAAWWPPHKREAKVVEGGGGHEGSRARATAPSPRDRSPKSRVRTGIKVLHDGDNKALEYTKLLVNYKQDRLTFHC
jgi:hypothetical protein